MFLCPDYSLSDKYSCRTTRFLLIQSPILCGVIVCDSLFFLPRLLLRLLQSPNASHKGSKVLVIPRLPIFIETCFPLCGLLYFMVLKNLLFFGTGKMWVDDISAECRLLVSGHGSVFIHRGLISGQFKSDIATGFSAAKRD